MRLKKRNRVDGPLSSLIGDSSGIERIEGDTMYTIDSVAVVDQSVR